jgi:uncharacterized protein (DUF169 family)
MSTHSQRERKHQMTSKIAEYLKPSHLPFAVLLTDTKPETGLHFKESGWGCVAAMMMAASQGKTAFFDRKTFGCPGGGVALGFGNQYRDFPITGLLSTGYETHTTPSGKVYSAREGERYAATPELAAKFVENLPMRDVAEEYVVFTPLHSVSESDSVSMIVLFVNPDQLSALVVLANYGRESSNNVIAPFCAGCQSLLYGHDEEEKVPPRAMIGFFDITARKHVEKDILSFTIPYTMYLEMEANVEDSFLSREIWAQLLKRNFAE